MLGSWIDKPGWSPCYARGLRTEARYPGLKPDAGHYESFFLRAARPSGGEGLWIRYTIDRAPGGKPASASLWLTWFEADAGAPLAAKASFAEDRLAFPTAATSPSPTPA